MAEGTRHARLEDLLSKVTTLQENQANRIDKQNSSIEFLTNSMKELHIGLQTMDVKVEQYIRKSMASQSENPHSATFVALTQGWTSQEFDDSVISKSMRLEVPRFSGKKHSSWISRIQRYFDFYATPDSQQLTIASFHLDGDALDWFDWMSRNSLFPTWKEFLIALEKCFGPSEYENFFGKLCKLVQLGTLAYYQLPFEHLADKIMEIPDHALVNCFISSLRPNLRKETLVYRPQSLVQAMGLAGLFDDKSMIASPMTDLEYLPANLINPLGLLGARLFLHYCLLH